MRTLRNAVLCCLVVVGMVLPVIAEVPQQMSYQGRLTNSEGVPIDTVVDLTITIFNDEVGTTALWSEAHSSVAITDGLFNIIIGSTNPLSGSVFDGPVRWLGVQISGESLMLPLSPIISSAYAIHSNFSDTADYALSLSGGTGGWTDDGTNVRLSTITDKVGIGTADPQEKLHVYGDIRLESSSDIAFGDDNTRINAATGGDISLQAAGDIHMQQNDDIYIHQGTGSAWAHFDNATERFGIGVINPQEKLHVEGDIRLSASSDIAFGDDNTRVYATSGDMVLTADDDMHLEPDDDIFVRQDGGSVWVHFDNSTERLGVGITNPDYKLTVNGGISFAVGGESKYHINYYQGGLNFAETGVQDRRIHIGDGGNVGIGTASPGAKLGVNGDLKVNGAFKGDISSSSNTDGAPFPRPAYNSGWVAINPIGTLTFNHNIGGDRDDYFVELTFKSNGDYQLHNWGQGANWSDYNGWSGSYWRELTNTSIVVFRMAADSVCDSVRVRIWVIE